MTRTRARRSGLLIMLVLAFLTAPVASGQNGPATVAAEDFTVELGDSWVTQAQMTYPQGQPGPFPTVVIVSPGLDMDFTITTDFGVPDVYFQNMAEAFTRAGLAVARYNKRYVTSATEIDFDQYDRLTPLDHRADAERVIAAVRARPRVDTQRLFLYGWSASTPIVASIASGDQRLRGIVLQGPVIEYEAANRTWYSDITVPYLRGFAPTGVVTPDVIRQAQAGDGGTTAKGVVQAFLDPGSPDGSAVNPFFDADGDGALAIDAEIVPKIDAWVAQLYAPGGLFANDLLIPDVAQQGAQVGVPVLVLQGENDAATPLAFAQRLPAAFAANTDFTFRVYPGLGHSLRATPDRIRDTFGPYEQQPVDDAIAWLLARSAAPAALPRTGGADVGLALAAMALALLIVGWAAQARMAARRV